MAKRAASHRAPPTLSTVNTKSPSIQQSMWLVLLDFPLVALITRREIQCVGSELATCESMVARRCPSCDPELPTSTANGDQKAPKTFQMAAKMHPKWCQNGIRNVSIELESTFLIFLQILCRLGEPFGSHFGAESDEKHIQKCIRKSTPEKYVKSVQNNVQIMPKWEHTFK